MTMNDSSDAVRKILTKIEKIEAERLYWVNRIEQSLGNPSEIASFKYNTNCCDRVLKTLYEKVGESYPITETYNITPWWLTCGIHFVGAMASGINLYRDVQLERQIMFGPFKRRD